MNIPDGYRNPNNDGIPAYLPKKRPAIKCNIKQLDIVSCHLFAMSPSPEAANLLGLWIEMKCQYAIWPS